DVGWAVAWDLGRGGACRQNSREKGRGDARQYEQPTDPCTVRSHPVPPKTSCAAPTKRDARLRARSYANGGRNAYIHPHPPGEGPPTQSPYSVPAGGRALMEVAGAKILVTGASSGIGAALARRLARQGATVGLVARRADRLEEVLADCREHTTESAMWPADLGDLATAESVALEAWDAFGHLDAVVHNAGIPKPRNVTQLTPDEAD